MPTQTFCDDYLTACRQALGSTSLQHMNEALADIRVKLDLGIFVGKDATRLRAMRRDLERAKSCAEERVPEQIIRQAIGMLCLASSTARRIRPSSHSVGPEAQTHIDSAAALIASLSDEQRKMLPDLMEQFEQQRVLAQRDVVNCAKNLVRRRRFRSYR